MVNRKTYLEINKCWKDDTQGAKKIRSRQKKIIRKQNNNDFKKSLKVLMIIINNC